MITLKQKDNAMLPLSFRDFCVVTRQRQIERDRRAIIVNTIKVTVDMGGNHNKITRLSGQHGISVATHTLLCRLHLALHFKSHDHGLIWRCAIEQLSQI